MFYVKIKIIYIEILWKISKFKIYEIEANISGIKLFTRLYTIMIIYNFGVILNYIFFKNYISNKRNKKNTKIIKHSE